MSRPRGLLFTIAGFALAAILTSPATAFGQELRPDRPYLGLFGGSAGGPQSGQTLDLSWSFLTAKDDDTQSIGSIDPRSQVSGLHGLLGTNLQYAARGKHASFAATAGSGGRYYPDRHERNSLDGHAGANFTAALGAKATIRGTEAFIRQPYYQFSFLPVPVTLDPGPGSSGDNALASRESYDSDGRVELERRVGRRSALVFGYNLHRTRFSGGGEQFSSQQASTQFTRGLTRSASLRVGYGYGQTLNTLGTVGPEQANHTLNLGLDYRRSLSFSRRTSVSFSSGSTMTSPNGHREVHIIGDANLSREIGRTWSATAGYHRAVQYMAGFSDALLSDTIQLQFAGLVGRRINAGLRAGYSSGSLGSSARDQHYWNMSGIASVRAAINRVLSIETQYVVYRYNFDRAVNLPLGLPSTLNRQGFRIGLTGWLPLFR